MSGFQDFSTVEAGTVYSSDKNTSLTGWTLKPFSNNNKITNPQVVFSGVQSEGNVLQWDYSGDFRNTDLFFLLRDVETPLQKPVKVTVVMESLGNNPTSVMLTWQGKEESETVYSLHKDTYTLIAPVGAQDWEPHEAIVLRFICGKSSVLRIKSLHWEYV